MNNFTKHKRFLRPILPVLCCYIIGLCLCRELYLFETNFTAWLVLFLCSLIGYFILRTKDGPAIFFIFVATIALGGMRVSVINKGRADAKHLLTEFAKSEANSLIHGIVSSTSPDPDLQRGTMILTDVTVKTSNAPACHFPGRVRLKWNDLDTTEIGRPFLPSDRVEVYGKLRPFSSSLQNNVRADDLNALKNIFATVRKTSDIRLVGFDNNISRMLEILREKIAAVIRDKLGEREGNVAVSMLFNDRAALTGDTRSAFTNSGLFHLFSVSGLHVVLLASILLALLSPLYFMRRISLIIVILCLILYSWMTQFNTPVIRATVMIAALFMGQMIRRPTDTFNRLLIAIFIIILIMPLAIWQTGFQLSVLCICSIVLLSPTINYWFSPRDNTDDRKFDGNIKYRLRYRLPAALSVIFAIFFFLLPAQLYYFGQCNILSPIANFIGVPLAEAAIPATLLTVILAPFSDWLSAQAGAAAALLISLLDSWATLLGQAQPFIIHCARVPGILILAIYAFLFSGLYLRPRSSPEYRSKSLADFLLRFGVVLVFIIYLPLLLRLPITHQLRNMFSSLIGHRSTLLASVNPLALILSLLAVALIAFLTFRSRRVRDLFTLHKKRLSVLAAILLAAVIILPYFFKLSDSRPMRIYFLNVGQGDATLIVTPDRNSLLVDCGSAASDAVRRTIVPQMELLGLDKVDFFIATHCDADHIGGFRSLVEQHRIDKIICQSFDCEKLRQLAPDLPLDFAEFSAETLQFKDGVTVDLLNRQEREELNSSTNANSLVVQVCKGRFSALLMGDATQKIEQEILDGDARLHVPASILKVGHHGSATATGLTFVNALLPTDAVISCGLHNPFFHPNKEVLDILDHCGAQIHRTDHDGTIVVETDGHAFEVLESQ